MFFKLDLESGRISLSAKDVEAGAMPHPGGSSKPWMQFEGILPIASIPVMEIEARLTFTLPGGCSSPCQLVSRLSRKPVLTEWY
jgi:hypothetical protein